MPAIFSLLLRFWPRNSVGTPKATTPAAKVVVLRKSRRFTAEVRFLFGDISFGIIIVFSKQVKVFY
jgi:2-methylaconitate cis-trans-isomerase PrpF